MSVAPQPYMDQVPRPQMTKTDVPGVYKRGERYAYTYRKRGRQRWGTARTKAEARRLKHQAETDVARGEHRDSTRVGFGEYARAWIAGYQGRTAAGVRPETRDWYRQMLDDRLIPYFDVETGLLLSEIEPRDIKSAVAWLAEQPNPRDPAHTLAPSTVGYHVAVLRAPFADAVEEGVVRSNPTSGVRATIRRTDDLGDTPTKALTRAQLRRLLDEFPDDRRLFFQFLAHTGLRISEAIEVRWHTDLDLGDVPRLRVSRRCAAGVQRDPSRRPGYAPSRCRPASPPDCERSRGRPARSHPPP